MNIRGILYLLFYDCTVFSLDKATKSSNAPSEGIETHLEPLIFFYDEKEIFLVRILWNPTMDIKTIIELAQREVSYEYDSYLGGPSPHFQPWRVLVRESDAHNSSSRYAFVKDDHCKELDFKASWRNKEGVEFRDVIQTLKTLPISQEMGAKVTIESTELDKDNQAVRVELDWSVDMTQWERILEGEPEPLIKLLGCRTLFNTVIDPPAILNGGRVVYFDTAYALHGCNFSASISFATFDNRTSCYARYQGDKAEALHIGLDCDSIPGFTCPLQDLDCNMDCSPNLSVEPLIEQDSNETTLLLKTSWAFPGASDGRTALGLRLRYFHSWLRYRNIAFDVENMTMTTLAQDEPSFLLLPSLSVTAQAMWVLQVCELYENCTLVEWSKVPAYPLIYYQYSDVTPTLPGSTTPTISQYTFTSSVEFSTTDIDNITATGELPENAAVLARDNIGSSRGKKFQGDFYVIALIIYYATLQRLAFYD